LPILSFFGGISLVHPKTQQDIHATAQNRFDETPN